VVPIRVRQQQSVHTVFGPLIQFLVGDSSHHHMATTVPRKRGLRGREDDCKNNRYQSSSHRCLKDEAGHSRSTMVTTYTFMVAAALRIIAPLKQSVGDEITEGTFGFPKKTDKPCTLDYVREGSKFASDFFYGGTKCRRRR